MLLPQRSSYQVPRIRYSLSLLQDNPAQEGGRSQEAIPIHNPVEDSLPTLIPASPSARMPANISPSDLPPAQKSHHLVPFFHLSLALFSRFYILCFHNINSSLLSSNIADC